MSNLFFELRSTGLLIDQSRSVFALVGFLRCIVHDIVTANARTIDLICTTKEKGVAS